MTPELSVIIPTYNERENIPAVIQALSDALAGRTWEAIFVDDDSADGTAETIATYARRDSRIRLLHRVGRRGLSSACIEGMMASQAATLAVMDADLQHDASILPTMYDRLHSQSLDIVVGTRNALGGSMGEFGRARVLLSRVGQTMSTCICNCQLSDPMSGFFLLQRDFLMEVVRDLRGEGFKILVDMLASARREVRLAEVGYTFRKRSYGESKLDTATGIEYLVLVLSKLVGDVIPVHLTMFMLVGALGLMTHLLALVSLVEVWHVHFITAQIVATFLAMGENFILNNRITFRDRRLMGSSLVAGALRFTAACSFGAWANVIFARALLQSGVEWLLAGLAGILIASVWNLSVSSFVTWTPRQRTGRKAATKAAVRIDTVEAVH